MLGESHEIVSKEAIKKIIPELKTLIENRAGIFESGLYVPDKFMMWDRDPSEPVEKGPMPKRLVHRYFVDDLEADRRGELVAQIFMYTDGILAFILDETQLEDGKDYVAEHIVLFFGFLCHFLMDLCTPVHIGHNLHQMLLKKGGKRYHQKFERSLLRYQRKLSNWDEIDLPPCNLSEDWLIEVAEATYKDYEKLPKMFDSDIEKNSKAICKSVSARALAVVVSWVNKMVESDRVQEKLVTLIM